MKPLIRSLNELFGSAPEVANAIYAAIRDAEEESFCLPPNDSVDKQIAGIYAEAWTMTPPATARIASAFLSGWRAALAWAPWQQGATVPARPKMAEESERVVLAVGTGEPNRTAYVTVEGPVALTPDLPPTNVWRVYPSHDSPVGDGYPAGGARAFEAALRHTANRLLEGGQHPGTVAPLIYGKNAALLVCGFEVTLRSNPPEYRCRSCGFGDLTSHKDPDSYRVEEVYRRSAVSETRHCGVCNVLLTESV
jgi:hypothetical protein